MKFRFRAIPLVATLILVALGIALGQWQTRRALHKEAIAAQYLARGSATPITLGSSLLAADEVEYRRVQVRGEFDARWPVFLDNRPINGNAGFYLMMPFRIADSDRYVLVARGWTARNGTQRTRVHNIVTPSGMITIEGIGRRNPGRLLGLGQASALQPYAIVQNLSVAEFASASKFPMQPFILEQSTDTHDGLVRDWPQASSGSATNRGYAFQWYALALMALLFFIVTGFRNGKK